MTRLTEHFLQLPQRTDSDSYRRLSPASDRRRKILRQTHSSSCGECCLPSHRKAHVGSGIKGQGSKVRGQRSGIKACRCHLRSLRQLCLLLTQPAANTIAASLITSRLDHCKFLWGFSLPATQRHRPRRIQNAAARIFVCFVA